MNRIYKVKRTLNFLPLIFTDKHRFFGRILNIIFQFDICENPCESVAKEKCIPLSK